MHVRVALAISSVEAYGKQTLSEPLLCQLARVERDGRCVVCGHLLEPLARLPHIRSQKLAAADDVHAYAVALEKLAVTSAEKTHFDAAGRTA